MCNDKEERCLELAFPANSQDIYNLCDFPLYEE